MTRRRAKKGFTVLIGTTLSHYEIVDKLGSGGMGDVYLAEDSELGRKVALKVLPPEMASSEERRARFKREARAIAALDHPNIVTVFSVEEAGGVHFMTMELVHGKTLSERQPKRGFGLDEFLDIAVPLADAVAAAHRQSITHRDLKPDNVMLSDDGRVKVLDFGLAKSRAVLAPGTNDSNLATEEMTGEGRILGTVAYMSPEQAEGKPVDERSDIFSLGVVFYEMLTGRRPFDGDTPASTLSAIIKDTPPLASALAPSLPHDLTRLLGRCLSKHPERRIQTCKDVRNELEDIREALAAGELDGDARIATPTTTSRRWLFGGALIVFVAGALVGAFVRSHRNSADRQLPRLTNPVQVTSAIAAEMAPTWSPEGGRIAYQSDREGNLDIWVSQLGGGGAVNLTGAFAGDDSDPQWSPDGSQIAFQSQRDGGGCFVMSALGGTPRRVVASPRRLAGGPAWTPDGTRLACPADAPFVEIVTVSSHEVERWRLEGEYRPQDLSWSPDGRWLAYVDAITTTADTTRLWITSVSGQSVALTDGTTQAWSPQWSGDGTSLFYVSNRGGSHDLWMQRLNRDWTPKGDPEAVTSGLGIHRLSLRADGAKIAYSKTERVANVWRVPIFPDRAAGWSEAEQLTFDQAYTEFVDISPDGLRLAVNSNRSGSVDLWTLPADGGEMQRVTNHPSPDWYPEWSPDGESIAFYSSRSGNRDIYVVPSSGGPVRQLTTHTGGDTAPSWSPDGTRIAYASTQEGNNNIWVLSVSGEDRQPLTQDAGHDRFPAWSPDGRWIVFDSNRGGERRLWRVGADGGEPELLTERSGSLPRWSPDGNTVYFPARLQGNEYWSIDLDEREERVVADLSGTRGSLVAHTTDGKFLYYTWDESLSNVWVMDVVWDE